MSRERIIYALALIALLAGCKKPYNPPVVASTNSYLVVEGIINAAGITTIKLSRTVNISSNVVNSPVKGAVLTIESGPGAVFPLSETKPGTYVSANLSLSSSLQYQLRIKTADNHQYVSDPEAVVATPPIDSVGFIVQSNGIALYVNTHDPNNNTHYYRWDYDETWQFHAKFESQYISADTGLVPRTPAQEIYTCFANDTSSTIYLGSSAKLSSDVIYQSPLNSIVSTSEKIEAKYSINVRQYALSGKAFSFWTNLKKNTEQLGSIFDAQPSNISGNIHNVDNATEPVIGYISVSTVQSKRVFISNTQLPAQWLPAYPYDCLPDSDFFMNPHSKQNDVKNKLLNNPPSELALYPFYALSSPKPIGYIGAFDYCADCTLRGTTAIPSFWK